MKKNIVVVGGGSSGWLSAAMFLKSFGNTYDITLIADEGIGNIGVGEATIPCIKEVFDFLEIPEQDWLSYCRGSFKYGISFEKWNQQRDFTHPYYDSIGDETYENFLKYWAFLRSRNLIKDDFDEVSGILPFMMREKLYSPDIHGDIAYHFDTGKLGEFLKDWSIERGATYINGHMKSSRQDEQGNISEIILSDGKVILTDFVIDCTGFSSLLLEGVHQKPFISFQDELLCDCAVVRWFDYSDTKNQRVPYTSAVAMEHGWMWKIPLKDRLSVGYVFSKRHATQEQIQEEMMKEIDMEAINDFRTIHFKTGYHEKSWVKNTLAIGLSYGFIEPLESTGIFLIYTSLFRALDAFENYDAGKNANFHVQQYNSAMQSLIHDVKNYVLYHYILNDIKGKFWQDARSISTTQYFGDSGQLGFEEKKAFSYDSYHREKFGKEAFFKNLSYYYILTGMKDLGEKQSHLDMSTEEIKKLLYVFGKRKKALQDKVRSREDYDVFFRRYFG